MGKAELTIRRKIKIAVCRRWRMVGRSENLSLIFSLMKMHLKSENALKSIISTRHRHLRKVKTIRRLKKVSLIEPPHGKTNNLHRRKQRRRSASR